MSDPTPQTLPPVTAPPTTEPEIQVIPDKFYGAALKAHVETAPKPAAQQITQPKRSHIPMILLIGVGILIVVGGAFVYFNRQTLFPSASVPHVVQPPVTTPPPAPVIPPAPPADMSATSTSPQSASLSWTDMATTETGYRVERADDAGTFNPLTNLTADSSQFLDTSVQAGKTYRYRVIALNTAGEAPSSEVSVTVQQLPPAPPEQPKLPPAGLDTDSDGLTDLEEVLYKSDPRNPDTDGDGFLDGNEVFHLYNPGGRAPARLLDAGLVKEYKGSVGWTMEVPTSWAVALDATDGSHMTVTTGHGESFVMTVEDNPNKLSVVDWYLQKNPTVKREDVLQYRSKKGYEGIIGADLLTTYLPWGNKIVTFAYNLDGQTFINFRTTYAMMMNSLELKGLAESTQGTSSAPLPFEPAATVPGVVTQPVPVDASSSTGGSSASGTTKP